MSNKQNTVSVCLVKSAIRRPKDQKATLVGLGLKRMNKVKTLIDTPAVRGMINKVQHLVKIVD